MGPPVVVSDKQGSSRDGGQRGTAARHPQLAVLGPPLSTGPKVQGIPERLAAIEDELRAGAEVDAAWRRNGRRNGLPAEPLDHRPPTC